MIIPVKISLNKLYFIIFKKCEFFSVRCSMEVFLIEVGEAFFSHAITTTSLNEKNDAEFLTSVKSIIRVSSEVRVSQFDSQLTVTQAALL